MSKADGYLLIGVGILWIVFTSFFGYWISKSYIQQLSAATSFVPVNAWVLNSRVRTVGTGTGRNQTISYIPEITCTYEVSGQTFQSDRYAYTYDGFDYAGAAELVRRYPQGTSTVIYYDPSDPREAVFYRGEPTFAMRAIVVGLIVGSGFALLGIGMWKVHSAHRRSPLGQSGRHAER